MAGVEGLDTTDERLDDPGDLMSDDEIAAAELAAGDAEADAALDGVDEDPLHLAKCAECAEAVRFRPNVTGTGFFLVDADPDASYGIGEHGRPMCRNGHGEMAIADDAIDPAKPAAEAFADAQGMLLRAEAEAGGKPVQADLPGILPAFNYQGCYLELEEKAAEVNALHEDYLEKKESAADAKKLWDKAAELYTKMALEFRRRRQAKGAPDAPTLADPPARALLCVWDKAHPDDACPFCQTMFLSIEQRAEIIRVLGAEIAPSDANAHADQVVVYRTRLDVADTADALSGVVHDVHPATIAEWTPEQRAAVREWAMAVQAAPDVASEPPFPAELGRPHRAGVVPDGEQVQRCITCTETIKTFDDRSEAYEPLAMVGLDCRGEEAEGHRYPDTAKPKRTRKPKAEQVAQDQLAIPPAAKKRAPKHRFPKPSGKKSGKKGR